MDSGSGKERQTGGQGQERKFPPAERDHEASHETAKSMRQKYIKAYGDRPDAIAPSAYSRAIFDKILAHPRAVGIRFYPAVDAEGQITMLFCGVDDQGDDILIGTIGDTPFRCPPTCSTTNNVLHF